MINGAGQLGIINAHINTSRDTLDILHHRKEAANRQMVQLRHKMADAYRNLARFRLDDLAANRVAAHLDETDRVVLKLLERREQEMGQLDPQIELSLSRQATLNAARDQAIQQRDDLVKQIDERAADIHLSLSRQKAYQTLEKRVAEETARAEQAERKAAQAEADQAQKGSPYRDDELFMYLWKRRFLTPDYHGRALTRRLDGWVATLIDYAEAHSNYHVLTELPTALRTHADRQREAADRALQARQEVEAQALSVDEMVQSERELEKVQGILDDVEDSIEAEEVRQEVFLKQRSDFSSGADDISRQAIDLQVFEIRKDSLAELYLQAKMTPRPDDDLIVGRIGDLQQQERKLEEEIQALQAQERQHQQSFRELDDLRRRYRRRGYDSRHSYFPGGFELGGLLALLMSGKATGRDVWERIDREQQFRTPRTPRGFGGGFGGGGFGTGGGFGGGGFRTGGGF
jgi:hypothetical protein